MSAGVSDQRMKGQGNQVSNGPKEQLGAGEGASGSEEFEPWRSQQQNSAAHTAYSSVPISSATDLYNMSTAGYYGSGGTYPYQAYGVGDGTWSNGTDPMTFLSTYPHDSYSMDGMFGPSTTFSTPTAFGQPSSFNYFHSNGDYSTWGSQLGGQRKYEDYYRDASNMYTQAMPDSIKSVEQAMQILDIKSSSDSTKESLGQTKKTTWASIASQPAKPQLSVQNQGLKKKGPGMPPGPIVPGKHNMDIGTWDTSKSTPPQLPIMNNTSSVSGSGKNLTPATAAAVAAAMNVRPGWNGPPPPPSNSTRPGGGGGGGGPPSGTPRPPPQHHHPAAAAAAALQSYQQQQQQMMQQPPHLPPPVSMSNLHSGLMAAGGGNNAIPMMVTTHHQQQHHHHHPTNQQAPTHPVLDELRGKNNYNPSEFDLTAPNARFFVIKSYSEDDIHRSIKYEIWCSTEHGNKRLDQAYREREGNGAVYLFFSVNGSGHFCGMAQMVTAVDYNANSSVWSQDKWKGQFKVRWIYVKDVPNVQLRHIRLENNENKPVTNSRDTQEVPHAKGLQVLRIMHSYRHSTSIFDDFIHYEKRQEEEDSRKQPTTQQQQHHHHKDNHHHHHHSQQQHQDNTANNTNNTTTNSGGGGGGHNRRNHDREQDRENHRSTGHRNNDHHGGHHKDRGDTNRGRGGRSGRN